MQSGRFAIAVLDEFGLPDGAAASPAGKGRTIAQAGLHAVPAALFTHSDLGVLAAGEAVFSEKGTLQTRAVVFRYDLDMNPVAGFGKDGTGYLTILPEGAQHSRATHLWGKGSSFIVAGIAVRNGVGVVMLAARLADGTPREDWGTNGFIELALPGVSFESARIAPFSQATFSAAHGGYVISATGRGLYPGGPNRTYETVLLVGQNGKLIEVSHPFAKYVDSTEYKNLGKSVFSAEGALGIAPSTWEASGSFTKALMVKNSVGTLVPKPPGLSCRGTDLYVNNRTIGIGVPTPTGEAVDPRMLSVAISLGATELGSPRAAVAGFTALGDAFFISTNAVLPPPEPGEPPPKKSYNAVFAGPFGGDSEWVVAVATHGKPHIVHPTTQVEPGSPADFVYLLVASNTAGSFRPVVTRMGKEKPPLYSTGYDISGLLEYQADGWAGPRLYNDALVTDDLPAGMVYQEALTTNEPREKLYLLSLGRQATAKAVLLVRGLDADSGNRLEWFGGANVVGDSAAAGISGGVAVEFDGYDIYSAAAIASSALPHGSTQFMISTTLGVKVEDSKPVFSRPSGLRTYVLAGVVGDDQYEQRRT